jgi:hypothetical protein
VTPAVDRRDFIPTSLAFWKTDVFLTTATDDAWHGVDGGTEWQFMTGLGAVSGYVPSVRQLAVLPSGAMVAAHFGGVLRSENLGVDWHSVFAGPNVHALAQDAHGALFGLADDGVVHRSADEGESWSAVTRPPRHDGDRVHGDRVEHAEAVELRHQPVEEHEGRPEPSARFWHSPFCPPRRPPRCLRHEPADDRAEEKRTHMDQGDCHPADAGEHAPEGVDEIGDAGRHHEAGEHGRQEHRDHRARHRAGEAPADQPGEERPRHRHPEEEQREAAHPAHRGGKAAELAARCRCGWRRRCAGTGAHGHAER